MFVRRGRRGRRWHALRVCVLLLPLSLRVCVRPPRAQAVEMAVAAAAAAAVLP